jgi:hypothetical protein
VASATLLTTLIDFTDTGVLDVFIDEAFVKFREGQFAEGGLMKGKDMASTFSFLRPNDLVWNYVVGNYLKGETPPPFDLLYWNSDSTNLPGPMYAWYLRNTYLENNLIKPGKATVCGEKIDLRKVDMPLYIYGSREDQIHPPPRSVATGRVARPASPKMLSNGLEKPKSTLVAGGPTGRHGSKHMQANKLQRPRLMAVASTKRLRPPPAATSKNVQATNFSIFSGRQKWKTSSSFQPHAPQWASLVVHSPKSQPLNWVLSSFVKLWHAPRSILLWSAKPSWAKCSRQVRAKTLRVKP